MATHLYHFNIFHSLSYNKFLCSSPLNLHIRHHQRPRNLTVFACSVKKPRTNRKGKSDEDLCNDIREFLSKLGLPQSHVPSMKELSQHGRQDLANIVRRRGYKYVRRLLEASTETNVNGSNAEEDLTGKLVALGSCEVSTDQNEKVEILADDTSLSSEAIQEDSMNYIETDGQVNSNDRNLNSSSCSTNLSLQEKVAQFIQNGELDIIEDSGFGITKEIVAEDVEGAIGSEGTPKPELASMISSSGGAQLLNGNANLSLQNQKVERPVLENSTSRNGYMSTHEVKNVDSNKNEDLETQKVDNQAEVKRLKFMLHQKELELTRLKQQVEKEKLALSALQTKAEVEISNAHKLISEKDAELYAAEESLAGLKEVEIEYSGDGETVELAGSFNGWNHWIKMDLHPPSSIINPIVSRKSQIWRTVLWLYPGVYEIKFIIDGHWRIDPEKESINRGTVHNNILRVDR
ncbi:protein PTST homolog 3, chloroplastic isoform X1 [Olea europaea var. sylvestris]|uniref:protein PTST homolog 3, chloroplastic isoform X1 n=2 Tax=Olea europaea var. sylvestris TaxID=158386 RepID=UPI000C1D2FDF|nr:protein PTST homolog 3, chloroplastic isoform X1 [Olea europaea var. sylvestris]